MNDAFLDGGRECTIVTQRHTVIRMTNKLDLPESIFRVKADYSERPPADLVRLILQFIAQFGTPHLWWGHTHTKPVMPTRVTFLAKYTLPESHHREDRWAPCPCCSPRHPKYFRHGLVAWFADEGVIRCVGDKCYKKMDPVGYKLAMKQLNAEILSERNIEFLLARIPNIPSYLRTIDANLPTLRAIDGMRNAMLETLDKRLAINLWPHFNDGVLRKVLIQEEVRRGRDGSDEVHLVHHWADYAFVPGHIALKLERSTLASVLGARRQNLSTIDFGAEAATRVAAMTKPEQKAAVKILSWGHSEAARLIAKAGAIRRFFTKDAIGTVNGWAKQEDCPAPVHFALDDQYFYVGRSETSHFRIPWPENFWTVLKDLEPLSKAAA